jgi:DNA-directed RNA polymerase subunit F
MGLLEEVAKGTDIFAFGLYLRLRKSYRQQFDDEYAAMLAVAVSNDVLSRPSGNEKGWLFQKENSSLIKEKSLEIKNNRDLCIFISEAVMMQNLLDVKPLRTSDLTVILEHYEQIGKPIEKLKEYGLYVENRMPTSFFALRRRMKTFVKMSKHFQKEAELT